VLFICQITCLTEERVLTSIRAYDKLFLIVGLNYGKLVNILDKEEFRIKLEEINHLVEEKDYKGAMNVVDSIDWRRVKKIRTLCVVGEIYAANKRYEESREIFLLAYHRAPIGKNILYRLIEISLKLGDIDEAMEFYEEFKTIAPNDNTRYILKYKIYKAKDASLSEQIAILEEYKEKEFTERWSYELAMLYYQTGEQEKCLELCNEMILWFSEGSYVMKALDLKMRMGALTGSEKEKYEQQFIPKLLKPEDMKEMKEQEEEEEISPKPVQPEKEGPVIETIEIRSDKDLEGTETLQEKISKGIRDIFGNKKKEEGFDEEEGENLPEEMIRSNSAQEEFAHVPELEQEGEKPEANLQTNEEETLKTEETSQEKADLSQTMKMPKLNIPESMKNMELQETPELEKGSFDFNLEETILAAASAQGIEIPDGETQEEPEEKPETEKPEIKEPEIKEPEIKEPEVTKAEAKEPVKKQAKKTVDKPVKEADMTMDDLEDDLTEEDFMAEEFAEENSEEEFSEEDLKKAEEEFLNGPSSEKEEIQEEAEDFLSDLLKSDSDFLDHTDSTVEEADEEEDSEDYLNLSEEEKLERFIDSIQPEDDTDPYDIIPREFQLSDEEKKLFTYFVKVPGMKNQLLDTLCDAQQAAADKTSRTGNIVVMGGRETGKTRLISSLIPAICKELNMEASKVAYVFAEDINGKNIEVIARKLSGGFFVIENANQLDQNTADQLDKIMDLETDGLTVILEDEKIGMRKMLARYPKLSRKFTSIINIPVFTNDELANFAKVYAKENGYRIENMGMLALYNLISMNQKEDQPMNIGAVKNMIDAAITKSQGGKLFKKSSSKKRVDRDGFIVLYEKDFSGK
jgi:tetratricopeptide (TPR) repeat protein